MKNSPPSWLLQSVTGLSADYADYTDSKNSLGSQVDARLALEEGSDFLLLLNLRNLCNLRIVLY